MKHRIKILGAVLVLAALVPCVLGAQTASGFGILSLENGYTPGYNLGTGTWNVASRFSLTLHVTDALSAGFTFLDGDGTAIPDYRFLRLSYAFLGKMMFSFSLGSTGANPVSGLGFDLVAFQRKFQDVFVTQMKIQMDYLFQPTVANGLTSGVLLLGIALGIGI